jgi:hypothetical protein
MQGIAPIIHEPLVMLVLLCFRYAPSGIWYRLVGGSIGLAFTGVRGVSCGKVCAWLSYTVGQHGGSDGNAAYISRRGCIR